MCFVCVWCFGTCSEPPPSLAASRFQLVQSLRQIGALLFADVVAHGVQELQVLLLESLKARVQFLVPRVQDKDLEGEGRARHHEVGDGDCSRNDHHDCDL